jgi:hypothetical protein
VTSIERCDLSLAEGLAAAKHGCIDEPEVLVCEASTSFSSNAA